MATIRKRETTKGVRWDLTVFLGRDPETGKQRFSYQTFERKKDAETEARRLEGQKANGIRVAPSRETFARYVRAWLDEVKAVEGRIRERTLDGHGAVVRRYLEKPPKGSPPLGGVRLDRLTTDALQRFYAWMRRTRGLSPGTVRSLHAVILPALKHATRNGHITRNVALDVTLPKMERRTPKAMSPDEANAFLKAAAENRLCALWNVLLTGGLRPSEAFALRWAEDVDLDSGVVRVEHALTRPRGGGWQLSPPKTDEGKRPVVIPPFAVRALRAWRKAQAAERLAAKPGEYTDHGFVFTARNGEPLDGGKLRKHFQSVMARAGLGEWKPVSPKPKGEPGPPKKRRFRPAYRVYDLRHTCATLLVRANEHVKVISERLGHANVAFTMDVYAAKVPEMQQGASEKLEAMLGG